MAESVLRIARDNQRKLPRKFNFTVAALAGLKVPSGKDRIWVFDERTAHLCYMLTGTGASSFYWYGRNLGKPVRHRLGGGDELSIEQARKLANTVMLKDAADIDIRAERKQANQAETFKELFDRYIADAKVRGKRTWSEDQEKYKNHLHVLGSRRAKGITIDDVEQLHLKIGAKTPGAANRVLALMSVVFNFGRLDNPAKGVKRFPEHERDRFLTADELRRFFAALKKQDQLWQDFFTICLLTGARSGNVKAMKWDELNLVDAVWKIPHGKSKSDKTMTVPLVPEVVEILERRKKEQKESPVEYVFPARSTRKPDSPGHIREPKTAWDSICKEASLADVWIHDLRRTNASWQAALGSSLHIIGAGLGHSQQSTTAKYARLDLTPVRQSIGAATTAMMAAAKAPKKASRKGVKHV